MTRPAGCRCGMTNARKGGGMREGGRGRGVGSTDNRGKRQASHAERPSVDRPRTMPLRGGVHDRWQGVLGHLRQSPPLSSAASAQPAQPSSSSCRRPNLPGALAFPLRSRKGLRETSPSLRVVHPIVPPPCVGEIERLDPDRFNALKASRRRRGLVREPGPCTHVAWVGCVLARSIQPTA